MKALTKIEAGATKSGESSPNTTLEDSASPVKQPLKATAPMSHMVGGTTVDLMATSVFAPHFCNMAGHQLLSMCCPHS